MELRIAIVRRAGDGLVQIAAVTDAAANLRLLEAFGVEVDARLETRPTKHARELVAALRKRFTREAVDGGPWYAADFFDVRAALAEYDLATGARRRCGDVALNKPVYVDGMGTGLVTGFSQCGRVEVAMSGYPGALKTLAPAGQVHPL